MEKLFGVKKNAKSELEMQVKQVLNSAEWDSSSDECLNKVSELFTKWAKINISYLNFLSCILFFSIIYNALRLIGFQALLLKIPSILRLCIFGGVVVTGFKIYQLIKFDKKTLGEWLNKLMVKKSEVKANNDLEKQKIFLDEKVKFLSNKRSIYRKRDNTSYLTWLRLGLFVMLGTVGTSGLGTSVLLASLITGFLSVCTWQANGFKQYDIPKLAYYQKKLGAVNALLKRGYNPEEKPEKIPVKHAYKHGWELNSYEARKNYDYKEIKTNLGYTKKRKITGVRTFK